MPEASDAPVWETLAESGGMISRIAVVPRGGLYMVNVPSRMLGLSGSEVHDTAETMRRAKDILLDLGA